MYIKNENLCIRNAIIDDCEQLAKWWNDGNVMAHAGFPNGLGTTAEQIHEQIAHDSDDSKRRLIIVYKTTSIGEMSYYNLGNSIVEIGVKICNVDYQDKGFGRIVLSMLIRELFLMGYEKIILDTNLKNVRAQHVYELLGFQKVRINENSWLNQEGELQSSVDYELTFENFIDRSKQ